MENANKPIMPLQDYGSPSHESVITDNTLIGLTKREYFAAMAMQGYFASCGLNITDTSAAQYSVRAADKLLKVLKETEDISQE